MDPKITHKSDKGEHIWFDPEAIDDVGRHHFDPDWVSANLDINGQSTGRASVLLYQLGDLPVVLRHYQRGGLVGRFNKDRFFGTNATQSRPFNEFSLLRMMRQDGLPVPRPIAARYQSLGLFYRADLITQEIQSSRTFLECLKTGDVREDTWVALGTLIERFHSAGIDHTDLNVRNILVGADGQFWLIDFDKCSKRTSGAWMDGNLARLRRSIEKEHTAAKDFDWHASDWDQLLEGYGRKPVS